MKFTKNLLLVAAIGLASVLTASAQLGFDSYNTLRTYVLSYPSNYAAITLTTNQAFDTLNPVGVAAVDIFTATNSGTAGGTLTFTLQGSSDTTNWSNCTNLAFISSYTASYITNFYYGGTNLIATNSVLLPGTTTSPTAWSAGFATPFLKPLPFTNSGALTVNPPGFYKIGFNVKDQNRYLRCIWNAGGTISNYTAGATITTSVTP